MSGTNGNGRNGRAKLPRPEDLTPAPRPPKKPGPGRRISLTPALMEAIREGLAKLPKKGEVRELLGISNGTFYAWLKRGRENPGTIFADLVDECDLAERRFEAARVQTVLDATKEYEETETIVQDVVDSEGRPTGRKKVTRKKAKRRGDWRAASFLLERRFPDRYGPKSMLEVEGELTLTHALTSLRGDLSAEDRARVLGGDTKEIQCEPLD